MALHHLSTSAGLRERLASRAWAFSRDRRPSHLPRPLRSYQIGQWNAFWPLHAARKLTQEDDCRPVKAKYFQTHVSSDDADVRQRRPSVDGRLRPPAIPERTTSLRGHRKTYTWPASISEQRKAGTCKFNDPPILTRTPWEWERGRPNSKWSRVSDRAQNLPRRIFVQLPREIYQCILDHLEKVHAVGDVVDVVARKHDLRSLCLVDKRWHRLAREHLYRDLWLPSNRPPTKRKWSTKQPKSQLEMLKDTIARTPGLGFLIHHIRIPTALAKELDVEAFSTSRKSPALDSLQGIVRQCYNLEYMTGYVLPVTTATAPMLEALASRTRLKSHAWNLHSPKGTLPTLADFLFCHDNWRVMETLAFAADPGIDLGLGAFSAVLHRLPSLRHLMISGLRQSDFSDTMLLALPPLRSLRLESLEGVTDQGIEQLAYSRLALSLERLSLVGLELLSLQAVQVLLSHLARLRRFVLLQKASPEPPIGVQVASGSRHLTLRSPSLQSLHWDCLIPGSAINWLAEAIEDGMFPRLTNIKVPCDYDGLIQRVCRPVPLQKLTPSDLEYLDVHTQHYERNLRVAQIQAQVRVRESRRQPSFNVVVQDESLEVQSTHTIGSYIGDMHSKIEYNLDAEFSGHVLVEFDDIAIPKGSGGDRFERRLGADLLF